MSKIEKRLQELDLELPVQPPAGKLLPVKQVGKLLFVGGHGPEQNGEPVYIGRVGAEVSLEEGYEAAKLCGLNCLARLKEYLGALDRIDEIVKVLGFVNSDPDFHQQPAVMHGFSDLMIQVFGEKGRHARSAIGTSNLPDNQAVEVEMIVTVRD
ncbi:MAG: RidA family protein [Firmicutes bacterium]|nr:RidA family protein [Bacillota bacterium]